MVLAYGGYLFSFARLIHGLSRLPNLSNQLSLKSRSSGFNLL